MVLKFLCGIGILLGTLLPGMSFGQVVPRLVFVDRSVGVVNLDNEVLAAVARQNWNDEDWNQAFSVYTWHSHQNQIHQPLAGNYRVEGRVVYFTPLFPFVAGEAYYAALDYGMILKKSGGVPIADKSYEPREIIDLVFAIPTSPTSPTFVEVVYPASDTLPANLLRMYIHFSAPMSMGEAYQHIQLQDERGYIVEKSFLIVDQELWDADRRRFTLLFDPGRIKRGIQSNLDLGMPLHDGHVYTLVVDSTWRDENGNALSNNFEKKMVVTASVREKLSNQDWKIMEPEVSTKSPLLVQFPKPLDHALALRYIVVTDAFNNIIQGKSGMTNGDRTWTFYPDKPWSAGHYTLQIAPYLEDPAGNNFNNPFDVDLSVAKRVNSDEPIVMSFEVKLEMN